MVEYSCNWFIGLSFDASELVRCIYPIRDGVVCSSLILSSSHIIALSTDLSELSENVLRY